MNILKYGSTNYASILVLYIFLIHKLGHKCTPIGLFIYQG